MVRELVKVALVLIIGMIMLPFMLGAELLKKADGRESGATEDANRRVPPRRSV